MAEQDNVARLLTREALVKAGRRAERLEHGLSQNVFFAAGGIRSLGDILSSHYAETITGLSSKDLHGLSLAVQSLGEYIELLCSELESDATGLHEHLKRASTQ